MLLWRLRPCPLTRGEPTPWGVLGDTPVVSEWERFDGSAPDLRAPWLHNVIVSLHASVLGFPVQQRVDVRFGLQPVAEFIAGSETAPHGDKEGGFLDHAMDAKSNVLGNHLLIFVIALRPAAGLSPGLDLQFVTHPIGIEIVAIIDVFPWSMSMFCVVPKLSFGIHVFSQ